MQALSLWQPWATLWATGEKRIETRSWAMRKRGWLLVHAAKRAIPQDELAMCGKEPFSTALEKYGFQKPARLVPAHGRGGAQMAAHEPNLMMGCVVGIVHVAECFRCDARTERRVSPQEGSFGNFYAGRYGFHADRSFYFPPGQGIPWRGAQGLFDIPLLFDQTDGVLCDDGREYRLLPGLTVPAYVHVSGEAANG